MATLRDLKPCIDDGYIVIRHTPHSLEFVDKSDGSYVYEPVPCAQRETFQTFDDLIESIGDEDEPAEDAEDYLFITGWDILDVEEGDGM